MRKQALAAFMAGLLLLSGCVSRTAPKNAPPPASSPPAADTSQGDAPQTGDGEQEEPHESGEQSAVLSQEELDEVVDALLEEGMLPLTYNYQGSFDKPEQIVPLQALWSIFKMFERQGRLYEGAAPDFEGYAQIETSVMDAAAARWYGVDTAAFAGNPQTLGDMAAGDVVNVDREKGFYFFMQADEPIAESVKSRTVKMGEDGTLAVSLDTAGDESGQYAQTYIIKLRQGGDGAWQIVSLNKGLRG